MTEVVLLQNPSPFPSPTSSSSISSPCTVPNTNNDSVSLHQQHSPSSSFIQEVVNTTEEEEEEEKGKGNSISNNSSTSSRERDQQLSLLALLVAALRKSLIGCSLVANSVGCGEELSPSSSSMEIGVPTEVRHVAHVTFDRFDGFLGLPVEFEPDVSRRPPSASTTVFGVSTESMQLSFDSRGNSVPTILLLMQRHLYAQGGLKAEGIFRITAENGQEDHVRDKLNHGVVPEGVDVHCLAGLIKAWFRELPTGVLDSLSPEQVMQSQSEEEITELVSLLPPMETALLDWAVNLMADVAQMEHMNKMNARNVAVVFAPNMTKMADPLTALMYAVQVMNILRTLIEKRMREREETMVESLPPPVVNPSSDDENGDHGSSLPLNKVETNQEDEHISPSHSTESEVTTETESQNLLVSIENIIPGGDHCLVDRCVWEPASKVDSFRSESHEVGSAGPSEFRLKTASKGKSNQLNESTLKKEAPRKVNEMQMALTEKGVGTNVVGIGRMKSRAERTESWR